MLDKKTKDFICLFGALTSRLVTCWLYSDGLLEGERKPVHTVGQGSAL